MNFISTLCTCTCTQKPGRVFHWRQASLNIPGTGTRHAVVLKHNSSRGNTVVKMASKNWKASFCLPVNKHISMQKYTASKEMISCDTFLRVPAMFAGQVASRWPQLPVLSVVPLMNIDPRIFCCHHRHPVHTCHTCPRLRGHCCKWGRRQFLIKHASSTMTNEGAT